MKAERHKYLTPQEFRRLLAAAGGRGNPILRPRNRLLLCLAGNLGLRVAEAVELRRDDVDLERHTLTVQTRKQRGGRAVRDELPLDKVLEQQVRSYLHRGRGSPWPRSPFLFPTRDDPDKHMSSRTAQDTFKAAARAAGLAPELSFHALRHFRGLQVWQATENAQLVKRLMRHRSLASSFVYAHMDPAKVAELQARIGSVV